MNNAIRAASAALLCLCVVGCGNSTPPATAPEDGKSILVRALDSWKKGDAAAGLASASPPLVVAEPRWESGWKLASYVLNDAKVDGFQARCTVQLLLVDLAGKSTKEKAEYIVTTAPKQTVSRISEGW